MRFASMTSMTSMTSVTSIVFFIFGRKYEIFGMSPLSEATSIGAKGTVGDEIAVERERHVRRLGRLEANEDRSRTGEGDG
jgi:hypothetical protein